MLSAKPTPKGGGILLCGDSLDLENLYDTIHYLVRGVPLEDRWNEFVLGLAYDVRKALEGQRETVRVRGGNGEMLRYRGEKVLWPIFLQQTALLRWSAAFHPTSRAVQAELFRLEYCMESSLMKYDGRTGRKVMEWYERFDGLPNGYLDEYLVIASRDFLLHSSDGKARFRNLPAVLLSIHPDSPGYRDFAARAKRQAAEAGQAPLDLRAQIDFPDFEW